MSRWCKSGIRSALIAVVSVGILVFSTHRARSADAPHDAALVKKGEYVARAADCMSCHTGDKAKPYAGSYPLLSNYGTIYSTNITTDRETGIGAWSKQDFENALRKGVSKDGTYLYPAMPYTSYAKMTDADMNALWAYMQTVAPYKSTPPKNTLPFPLSVRTGLIAWQGLYLSADRFAPNTRQNAEWNRGAYLVQALAHCADCHTPRNVAQGPESQHQLGGAQISGWFAPDISNDPNSKIAYWDVNTLTKFLKTGNSPGNTKSFGPMQEVVHDSLQYLTDADVRAMAVYLKDSSTNTQPVKATKTYDDARIADGKVLYENNCSSCHQNDGKGIKSTVPALAGSDSVTATEPYNAVMAMLQGFQPQGSWGAMASFANALNDDQIAAVANYIRTAWGNQAAPNATPWSVSSWRKNATVKNDNAEAMLCPNLAQDVIDPALKATPDSLKQAAQSRAAMGTLVSNYQRSRPNSSKAQVIEALSTAYCRSVVADHVPQAQASAKIAYFAQGVAGALNSKSPPT
jgi:mono/diheme cytochrome c family protein